MRHGHLLDEELLLLAADELPWWKRAGARSHLAACSACGMRSRRLEASLEKAGEQQGQFLLRDLSAVRSEIVRRMSQPPAKASTPAPAPALGGWQAIVACLGILAVALAIWGTRHLATTADGPHPALARNVALPIRRLTPGAVRVSALDELCRSQDLDNDPQTDPLTVQKVFAEYGLPLSERSAYEVDFLITPGLGGSEDIRNLWPEPYAATDWNARVKNQLETHLHQMVCAGQLPLSTAQAEIAGDWISAYKRAFHTERPLTTEASLRLPGTAR